MVNEYEDGVIEKRPIKKFSFLIYKILGITISSCFCCLVWFEITVQYSEL